MSRAARPALPFGKAPARTPPPPPRDPITLESAAPPPPPPPPAPSPPVLQLDAATTTPFALASAPLPLVASSRDLAPIDPRVGAPIKLFADAAPEPTEPVRPKLRPRSWAKSTQRTRPDPAPRPPSQGQLEPPRPERPRGDGSAPAKDRGAQAVARGGRNIVWLILLMVALGSGAMAAAYFWPDL
jgi:hypothetical protein